MDAVIGRVSGQPDLKREHVQRVLGGWLRMLDAPTPTTTWEPSGPRSTAELAARAGTISKPTDPKKGKRR